MQSLDDLHASQENIDPVVETPVAAATPEPVVDPVPGEPSIVDGMDSFLSDFGIGESLIDLAGPDGEVQSVPFDELDEETKYNVLTSLVKNVDDTSVPKEYQALMADIQASGKTPEDFINDQADARSTAKTDMDKVMGDYDATDYQTLSPEDIMFISMVEADATKSDEDIFAEIEELKKTSVYDSVVKTVREKFISTQKASVLERKNDHFNKETAITNEAMVDVVTAVDNMTSAASWELDDSMKEEILGEILPVGEGGTSAFMEAMKDPEKLFTAAWMYNKGPGVIDTMEAYYIKREADAYTAGKKAALRGVPGTPQTHISRGTKVPVAVSNSPKKMTLEELHAK